MDWPLAISRNRDALRAIIAALFALAGLTSPARGRGVAGEARYGEGSARRSLGEGGRGAVALPRHILAAILLVLRPAESAVRRLIYIAANLQSFVIPDKRSADPGSIPPAVDFGTFRRNAGGGDFIRTPAFALFDSLKSFDPDHIWNMDPATQACFESGFNDDLDPAAGFCALPDSQQPVPAAQIIGRLFAVGNALETLPNQARRLLRWQARRDAALKAGHRTRITPLRPGLPPGWRQRSNHEIDDLLKECHRLAIDVMNADTS